MARKKNPGAIEWISENPALFAGGVGVSLGGFFVMRKVIQHRIAAEVVKEYEKDPIVLGSAIYISAFDKVPSVNVTSQQARQAGFILARRLYPIFGLPILPPSRSDIIVYAQQKALQVAKKDPGGLADLAVRHGGDIIQTGLDLFAQTQTTSG